MSGSSWKQDLTSCCLYVYGDELKTISAEDLANVDGVSAAIPVPDPADSKGGDRFLVLFNNQIEVKRFEERKSIICNDTELKVEHCNDNCDIPDNWKRFVGGSSQTALQYPSNEAEDQTDLYANVPSRQEQADIYNMPPMDSQLCRDSGGQQLPVPQGQQNPMIPGQHPFPMMPPFMFPQGATAHENPTAGGHFWTSQQQQLWMQQMQMFFMQQGRMPDPTAPPPYAASEEKSGSEPEARCQSRISEPSQLDDREAANHDYDEDLAQEDKEAAMLKLTNIPPDTSEDSLFFYFENRRKSGGGPIKELEYDPDTQSAVITFEDPEVIGNILGKKHKIDGTAIDVFGYVPPPPPKPVPMYLNKVLIKNLSEKTTKDGLANFLEVKTSITPTSIEYGELEGTALVTFDENLDFEKLQLACKKRSLDKSHLEVCKVPVTNCVIVRNVSEKTSRDTLEFYFDNERRSGVTGVLDVKMCDGFCLVYFEEPEAIDVVCVKSHRVDGQILEVKIYYECLGQVESEEDGPFHPPGPLELTDLDTKKMQFLMKSPPNQEAVQKQLEAVYGKPVWPKKSKVNSLSVECTLTAETKDGRKIGRTWEGKVKENMNKFMDLLVVTKHSTLKEAFPLVLNELKSLTISNSNAVAVVLEKSNHEIYVTGHKQASMEVSKQISDIIQKMEAKLDKKNQQIQEELKLKRHQVLILQFCKFEQNIQKKYKEISLKYDLGKNCVKFEGLSGEVTTAILEMFEFVSKVVKTEVGGISKLLQGFLQNQPVYKYVNAKMREKDVVGVWEFNKEDESLTVFSLSDQQAVHAAHLLKESVIETSINVKEESRPLLTSGEWQNKSSELEQQGEGLIKIVTHTAQIIILCTDKWEALSRDYIDDFLEANTVYEGTLSLEPGMMRYIQMNCAEAIDKVDKDLQQERGAAKISSTGIMVRGNWTGFNKGKFAIGKIVQSVEKQLHTINKPGIRKHMESQQGRDKLKNVERSQGVVIDVNDESVSYEDNDGSFLKAGAMRRELAVCMTSVEKKISALVVDNEFSLTAFTTEEKKQGGRGGRHGRQFGSHSRPTLTPRGKGGASPGGRNYGGGSSSDLSDSEEFVLDIGNLEFRVYQGDITTAAVDVIVNSTNPEFDLTRGLVSKIILQKGGDIIKKEVLINKGDMKTNGMAITTAVGLNCQYVLHVDAESQDGTWEDKITKAILRVDEISSCQSVAFPTLGQAFGLAPEKLASHFFEAIVSTQEKVRCLKQIHVVIYESRNVNKFLDSFKTCCQNYTPKSKGVFKKFTHWLGYAKGGASPGGRNYGGGSSSDLSDSEEFVLDIGNLEFRVYQGDITRAAVDVIVNSTNPEFDLTRSLVSKIILQKGGDAIKKEVFINKNEMKTNGMAVTTAVGLNCQYVLHVDAESQDDSWEDKITKAILRVDEISSCQSVAFPTLGQAFGLAPEKLASHFFEAVVSTREKVRCLKQIHVVIYESRNVNKFLDSFKTCCQNYTPKSKGDFRKFINWLGLGTGKSDILDNARRNPRIVEDTRSVTLVIYGKTPEQIKKAIHTIDGGNDSLFTNKVFTDSIIKQFSSSQENKIKQLKETYDVEVTIEPRIGRIMVHGLIEDVMNAADKVHEVIRKADAARQEKQAAEIMADMVEWCFIDITSNGQKLEKYPPEINMQLEKALRNQDSKVSFSDKDGKRYIVDLATYENYPEDDKMDVVKVIRKNKIDKSAFEPPVTWSAMDAKDNVAVVTLVPRCEEYKKVAQNFIMGTGSAYSIVKIERIQNRMLLQQYEAKFKLMEKQNPTGTTNEKMLWHGTGSDAVASINTYGFNRSYCRKFAVVHGDGVYFAVNANYSARDTYSPRDVNNNKRMYQCRVLTGEFCQSKQGMKVPPNKPGYKHILYDSAVDTPRNPGIFVIFNNIQAYPEYLITFQ